MISIMHVSEKKPNSPEAQGENPISYVWDGRTSHESLRLRAEKSPGDLGESLNWQHKKSFTCNIFCP